MPQHGSPSSLPMAPVPLLDEEGQRTRARRYGPGWRGKMKAQLPAWPRGWLSEDTDWGAFVFIFCSSSPTPARTQTHTDKHGSSSGWMFFLH